jgi:hypothetical protein
MTEYYIYMSKMNNNHFFYHIVLNEEYKISDTYNIYNVLIDENIINNTNENVIIYDIYQDKSITPIITQHYENQHLSNFDMDDLLKVFNHLYDIEFENIYIIEYHINNKLYKGIRQYNNTNKISLEGFKITNIIHTITNKKIV